MIETLRRLARDVERNLAVYRRVASHPRTPRRARWLLGAAIAYVLLPFDLIPDFLPIIGHLDDLVIVPLLVWLALRAVPRDVVAECRAAVDAGD